MIFLFFFFSQVQTINQGVSQKSCLFNDKENTKKEEKLDKDAIVKLGN